MIFAAVPDDLAHMERCSSRRSKLKQRSVEVVEAPRAVVGPVSKKVPERSVTMDAKGSRATFAFVSTDQCDPVADRIALVTAPHLNSIFWPQGVTGAAYVCFMVP